LDIERSLSEKIRKLNDSLQDEWDIEVPTINEVLHSNIAGEFPWPYQEAPYKDVLKLLCSYFGDTLPNDVFNGMSQYGVKFIEEEVSDIADLVFHSKPPVAIPGMDDETMYRVGHMSHETAKEKLDKWKSIARLPRSEDEWEEESLRQFYGWLEASVKTHRGIVTFFD